MFSGAEVAGAEVATPPFTNLAPLDVSSMERLAQNALHAGQLAQMALAGEHLTPSCVTSLIPSPKGDPTPCATLPANLNPYSLATTPATKPPPPVGGPAKRAGSGKTRRSSYTVEFKRQLVMEALRRPAGNRIRPTCAQYPGVEPCQLRKWIRALEAEVRAQPDVQMMLAALEGAPAAAHQPRRPPPPIMPPLPALAIDAPPAGAVHLTAKWQPAAVAFAAVTPPTDGAEADPRLLAVTRLAIFPRRLRWWATRTKAVLPAVPAASTAAPSASAAPSAAPAVA